MANFRIEKVPHMAEAIPASLVAVNLVADGGLVVDLHCECGRQPPCWVRRYALGPEDHATLRAMLNDLERERIAESN